jgi:AcrR family transcriptional regulator
VEMSTTELVGDVDALADEGESPRPRRRPLTRQRIVQAALRIMDEEGLEAVSMRHIGRALEVEAMSLYNHVRDKEEILDSICEEVLSGFRVPEARDWREAARAGAREYRRLLLAHPRVITLMTGRKGPVTNANSLKAYEFALGMFLDAGLTAPESVKALNALASYILGSVTLQLGLTISGPPDEARARAQQDMARLAAAADFPHLRECLPHFAESDVDDQFEFGLSLLIDAVAAKPRQEARRPPPPA